MLNLTVTLKNTPDGQAEARSLEKRFGKSELSDGEHTLVLKWRDAKDFWIVDIVEGLELSDDVYLRIDVEVVEGPPDPEVSRFAAKI
jgi:hypothetical protein